MRKRCLALALLLALAPAGAGAQTEQAVSGVVLDVRTGAPIKDVVVSSGRRYTGTDDAGRFRLCRLPADEPVVSIYRSGYAEQHTVVREGGARLEVVLHPDSTPPGVLDRSRRRHGLPAAPPPIFILDGERILLLSSGCEEPRPGVRVLDEVPMHDVEEISVLRGEEAVARFGPEAEHGAVVIRTRKPPSP